MNEGGGGKGIIVFRWWVLLLLGDGRMIVVGFSFCGAFGCFLCCVMR